MAQYFPSQYHLLKTPNAALLKTPRELGDMPPATLPPTDYHLPPATLPPINFFVPPEYFLGRNFYSAEICFKQQKNVTRKAFRAAICLVFVNTSVVSHHKPYHLCLCRCLCLVWNVRNKQIAESWPTSYIAASMSMIVSAFLEYVPRVKSLESRV